MRRSRSSSEEAALDTGRPVAVPALMAATRTRLSPSASPAIGVFAGAVAASAGLLVYLNHNLGFFLDDWDFLIYRPGWTAHSLLDPHNEHISILPVAIFKALVATVGLASAVPFHAVEIFTYLLSVVLLFAFLRRRVGDWAA